MPFFTVILPLYNKEKYVKNAINSILNQTFSNFELLLVNDCSTDNSVSMASEFVSEKVKIIHHDTNKGLSATRNTGIKNATAQYITFLDADDLWKPNFLETIYHLIQNFPDANIFATSYEENWGGKTLLPKNGNEILPTHFKGYINFFEIVKNEGIYNHGSVCFSKKVYEKVGYYNENIKLYEDLDFNIRANYYFKIAYAKTIGMTYFMHTDNQLTRQKVNIMALPNYNDYEHLAKNNLYVKKHLDLLRFLVVKKVKQDYNGKILKKIVNEIDKNNLNWKQKLVLILPNNLLLFFSKMKQKLAFLGYKTSTLS